PHGGNLIRTEDGLCLIDWDTVALAPPERDLWMLDDGTDAGLQAYTETTGHAIDRSGLDFYRLAWLVTDVAAFTTALRRPHTDASPISRRPVRWAIATRVSGQRSAISSAILRICTVAISANASYSRCVTVRPRDVSRTMPVKVLIAPARACVTALSARLASSG